MSILTLKLLQPYMNDNDGDGNDAGGGAPAADRGDNLPEPAADEGKGEDKGDEGEDKGDKGEDKGDEGEEPARDDKGRFQKKNKDEGHIPKARFDDAVGKERAAREAAERRAAEAEARLKQEAKSVDIQKMEDGIEALEKQHAKLLLDGEADKAAAVMKEIRKAERQIANLENDEKLNAATNDAVEKVRVEAAVARLESDYPELNENSEDFNPKLVNIVLAEQRRLIGEEGMTPAAALTRAAKDVMDLRAPKDDAPGKSGLSAAATDRKSAQVAKNLDSDKRQPASLKDTGKDSDKLGEKALPNVAQMTKVEFDALPETTKAKLRGDFV